MSFEFTLKDGRSVTIRRFGPRENAKAFQEYINALVKTRADILADTPQTLADEKKYVKGEWGQVKSGSKVHWLAVANDGRIAASMSARREPLRDRFFVALGVGVHPAFQGQGLGEFLLRHVIADAKRAFKPKRVFLTVLETNRRARKLYEKVGFVEHSRRPKWHYVNGKLVGNLTMVLRK